MSNIVNIPGAPSALDILIRREMAQISGMVFRQEALPAAHVAFLKFQAKRGANAHRRWLAGKLLSHGVGTGMKSGELQGD